MRYVAMQVLTWGTVVGTLGSALLLATLNGDASSEGKVMNLADAGSWHAVPADLAQLRLPEQRAKPMAAEQAASQPQRR